MSLDILSARLQEAKADLDLADELATRRPTAAVLLYAQGAGQALRAAAEFHGVILDRDGMLRGWAETLRAAGHAPGFDRDMATGLRDLGNAADEIRLAPAGAPTEVERKRDAAARVTREVLLEIRRAVEARNGPIRIFLEAAEDHARIAKEDRTQSQAGPAAQVERFHEAIDAALSALWVKARSTHGLGYAPMFLRDRYDGLRACGALDEIDPAIDRDMAVLNHWRFRAERERTTNLGLEPVSEKIAERAAHLAGLVLDLARARLAEDLAPLTIPEPRHWAGVQAEEWARPLPDPEFL